MTELRVGIDALLTHSRQIHESWRGIEHDSSQMSDGSTAPRNRSTPEAADSHADADFLQGLEGLQSFQEWGQQVQSNLMQSLHDTALVMLRNDSPDGSGSSTSSSSTSTATQCKAKKAKKVQTQTCVVRKVNRPQHNHSKEVAKAMREWFAANFDHPYPDQSVKARFALMGGLSVEQITSFFINERKRSPSFISHKRRLPSGTEVWNSVDYVRGAGQAVMPLWGAPPSFLEGTRDFLE